MRTMLIKYGQLIEQQITKNSFHCIDNHIQLLIIAGAHGARAPVL